MKSECWIGLEESKIKIHGECNSKIRNHRSWDDGKGTSDEFVPSSQRRCGGCRHCWPSPSLSTTRPPLSSLLWLASQGITLNHHHVPLSFFLSLNKLISLLKFSEDIIIIIMVVIAIISILSQNTNAINEIWYVNMYVTAIIWILVFVFCWWFS